MTFDDDDDGAQPVMTAEVARGAPSVERMPDEDPDGEDAPQEERPRKGLQERFNQLTSRIAAERTARARAERRAYTAEALMRRLGQGPRTPMSPAEFQRLVDGRVAQTLAAHAFNARSNAVHAAGVKAFPDFEDRIGRLQATGVLHPHDPRLLAAVLETEAPEKVLHHLGGDPDEAERVAQLSPVRQAAELARVAMKVGQPGYRPVSKAPAPISPIGGATARKFDPTDESVPIAEWMREMDRRDQARRERR
jgi:hypothetical protein